MLQDTSILSFTHVIQNHTMTMYMREKPNICRKIRMNQLRKTFKVIKNRDFYKVSKYIDKYKFKE